jgi:hypothetical protein
VNPRSKRSRLSVAAIVVALACIAIFLPELAGFGWHLTHGPEAHYRDWRIPVPAGWFATRHGKSLTLEHMLHFPLREDIPTVVFLPMYTQKNLPFDPGIWTRVQTSIQNRRGYQLASTRHIEMGGATGYCWEFVKRSDDSRWWITCLAPSERLSADFSGEHAYAAAFYAILPAIHRRTGKL